MKDIKNSIIEFWFEETTPQQWFQGSSAFDDLIRTRFLNVYEQAAERQYDGWKTDAVGCLALCIALDQFPRNLFRGQAKAFATDQQALLIAKDAIQFGFYQTLSTAKRSFLYMPFMHSENLDDQRRSVELFSSMKEENPMGYEHALRHHMEIERFGRFPYRNKARGLETTPEEEAYLKTLPF